MGFVVVLVRRGDRLLGALAGAIHTLACGWARRAGRTGWGAFAVRLVDPIGAGFDVALPAVRC